MTVITTEKMWREAVGFGLLADEVFIVPGNEWNGMTVGDILDCGCSNPFADDYSLVGEIDTGENDRDVDIENFSQDIDFAEYSEPEDYLE